MIPPPTCARCSGSTRKSTLPPFTRTSSGHIRGHQRPYRWPVWPVNLSWGSAVLPRGATSGEARADGDLAAAGDANGGRSAHRSISQRVWVVWEQGRPRGQVGSCETSPWWPAVSSSRHVDLRVPGGGYATRTSEHKATTKPPRAGAPAPRWPMTSAWRRGGSSEPAGQPPVAACGGAATRLNRAYLEREQRPRRWARPVKWQAPKGARRRAPRRGHNKAARRS